MENKWLKNKEQFLVESFSNETTRALYRRLFTGASEVESRLGTDIKNMSVEQVKSVLNSHTLITQHRFAMIIKKYTAWCKNKGEVVNESLLNVSSKDYTETSSDIGIYHELTFENLYNVLLEAETQGGIMEFDTCVIMLARDGMNLEEMAMLKFSDIEGNIAEVNGKTFTLNQYTIEACMRCEDVKGYYKGSTFVPYFITNNVIKQTRDANIAFGKASISRRITKVNTFELYGGDVQLTTYNLRLMKKFDILNSIIKIKHELSMTDYKAVNKIFNNEHGALDLKLAYEKTFGIK